MDTPTITTAAAWRQAAASNTAATEPLALPSGAVVLVRRPPLIEWLTQGRLPQALCALVVAGRGEAPAPPSVEDVLELGKFVHRLVLATVVEPRIVRADPVDGEIAYDEIPTGDVDAIVAYASRSAGVTAAAPFRGVAESAAAGSDGADVRPAAEHDGGDQ